MKAIWNDTVIAQSDDTIVVENNHYFPPDSLKKACFSDSDHTSWCSWKGEAHYYHIEAGGQTNANAAWVYRNPKPEADRIRDYVAFWKGIEITE
ncbi:MAG: DUF427 domain-containing protein [Pseudomonadota bacterium]